ncbi:MAG: YdeI/OmpD-associated family protein [Candidatus Bathyarchaeota archaeon]|nr:YdeI/OmpD-associated family protein [Candidatus Bathyarchaeota archaeon]
MSVSEGPNFRDRVEWRRWLEENHSLEDGAWVIIHKKGSKREGLRYDEAVDEAVCFGWIDGGMRSLDGERFRLWFSPRRRGSVWSLLNRERVERLMEAGLMAEAGLRAVEDAKESGMWDTAYTSRVEPEVPEDLMEALREDQEAWRNFEGFSNSAKLMYVHWVESAKREETRTKRISEVVRRAVRNIKPG